MAFQFIIFPKCDAVATIAVFCQVLHWRHDDFENFDEPSCACQSPAACSEHNKDGSTHTAYNLMQALHLPATVFWCWHEPSSEPESHSGHRHIPEICEHINLVATRIWTAKLSDIIVKHLKFCRQTRHRVKVLWCSKRAVPIYLVIFISNCSFSLTLSVGRKKKLDKVEIFELLGTNGVASILRWNMRNENSHFTLKFQRIYELYKKTMYTTNVHQLRLCKIAQLHFL